MQVIFLTSLSRRLEIGPDSVKGLEGGSLWEIKPGELSSLIERWEHERRLAVQDVTQV